MLLVVVINILVKAVLELSGTFGVLASGAGLAIVLAFMMRELRRQRGRR